MDAAPFSTFPDALRGKRILLCTESFGPVNGVSRTTMMLVNHLRTNGTNVVVVAPHTAESTFVPEGLVDAQTSRQRPEVIRIHGYPLPFNPELSIVYPARLSTLYRKSFGSAPDLIYLASPASLGFQVMLQLRQQPAQKQIPIICNFQTDLAGYCAILFPWPLSNLAVLAFARVQSFLFNHKSVQTIFYPSRFVRRYLEEQRVQSDKLEVLQRGVDTELFHPARRSNKLREEIAPAGEVVLICVSRLAGEKGFGFLADAARALDARGLKFKLYIVGGNRNAAVEAEIKDSFGPSLTGRGTVIFAGFRVGEALAAAYASADIFLHCSTTETFGLVVLESMASGVPVVARDEGGPSDIVRDGETGYLTPPADLTAFVDRVMVLTKDAGLREQLGRNARAQAEQATWERINNKVAWRMVETIARHQKGRSQAGLPQNHSSQAQAEEGLGPTTTTPLMERSMPRSMPTNILQGQLANARLAAGMVAISLTWVVVGAYLVFIKVGFWIKAASTRCLPRHGTGLQENTFASM
ncbi:hypothetical protein CHGG_05237 [Chaetomium globosum CBS 148.51]|uniref:Glycosyl transferase family 1 domain-containing protein n=1 Tax=Chaetomium globosum (strain ATCC 6205 / CBS 148.51 / DSM 1962 / NBRC 6347 / NRRL 1970) TaxID=306901 RepID=Q2GZ09_CHAGB|nr:uncharacterized protein CHGG_05237 [Chaetomium globosum CBS 148.51]EAQ88618.1 hypothetical protein CHGG_05237 [Chaetomium globosum CBS 148.51]